MFLAQTVSLGSNDKPSGFISFSLENQVTYSEMLLRCKIGLRGIKAEFIQNRCLVLL